MQPALCGPLRSGVKVLYERKHINGSLTERGLRRSLLLVAMVVFGLFVVWRFLAGVATVVLLLLLGVLLAVALSAPVEALYRRKVPRSVSSPLVAFGALAFLLVPGYLFFPQIQRDSLALLEALPGALESIRGQVFGIARSFGLEPGAGSGFSLSSLSGFGEQLLGGLLGVFSTFLFFAVGAVATIFVAVYLAASPGPVVDWLVRFFPPERRPRVEEVLSKSRSVLLSWLGGRLTSMGIIAVLSTVALYIIGVPGALVLGIFAGLVAFVPYIGPIVSVIPPALLALAERPVDAVWVVVAYVAIQQIESYLITPLIMEKAVSMHPAAVIGSVTLLGTVFGFLGALMALPITVVVNVLIEELWFRRMEKTPDRKAGT